MFIVTFVSVSPSFPRFNFIPRFDKTIELSPVSNCLITLLITRSFFPSIPRACAFKMSSRTVKIDKLDQSTMVSLCFCNFLIILSLITGGADDCFGILIKSSTICEIFDTMVFPNLLIRTGISVHANFVNWLEMVDAITLCNSSSISPVIPPLNFKLVMSKTHVHPFFGEDVSIYTWSGTLLIFSR